MSTKPPFDSAHHKKMLEKLYERAVAGLTSVNLGAVKNAGKAFEIYALAVVLRLLRKHGFTITAVNATGGVFKFPGGPSKPDPAVHSYFIAKRGSEELHIWVSIETETLSAAQIKKAGGSTSACLSDFHEVDVGVFENALVAGQRPSYSDLVLAVSCKHQNAKKEQVREALGLRRETAFYSNLHPSKARWFVKGLKADPAIPLILFSRDAGIKKYASTVEEFGVFLRFLPYKA